MRCDRNIYGVNPDNTRLDIWLDIIVNLQPHEKVKTLEKDFGKPLKSRRHAMPSLLMGFLRNTLSLTKFQTCSFIRKLNLTPANLKVT